MIFDSSNERTVLLHDSEELDDDLGGRTDQDLALASLLGVVHGVEGIVEDGSLDHFGGIEFEILKSKRWDMRYLYEFRVKSATSSLRAQRVPLCRSSSARAGMGDAYHRDLRRSELKSSEDFVYREFTAKP